MFSILSVFVGSGSTASWEHAHPEDFDLDKWEASSSINVYFVGLRVRKEHDIAIIKQHRLARSKQKGGDKLLLKYVQTSAGSSDAGAPQPGEGSWRRH